MNSASNDIAGPFDEDFCSHLEYHLTRTFSNSGDKSLRSLWCDGIQMPFVDNQLKRENIESVGTIETKAWIGNDGQGEYFMTIKFGVDATGLYIKG